MKLISLNVSLPRLVEYNGEPVATGIEEHSEYAKAFIDATRIIKVTKRDVHPFDDVKAVAVEDGPLIVRRQRPPESAVA